MPSVQYLTAKEGFFRSLYQAAFGGGNWELYLEGIINTLIITSIALLIGVVFGVLLALAKMPAEPSGKKQNPLIKILRLISEVYITVIRGTPVVVQLLIVYYVILAWVPRESKLFVASVAFGLNSAAYVAEIIRGGIQSIPKGQTEAGRSLGLSHGQTMWHIVLPQAVRNILPALFNEFIALLKETSVAGYVAIVDITRAGDMLRARDFTFYPLLVSALIYLILVLGLTQIQKAIERRLSTGD